MPNFTRVNRDKIKQLNHFIRNDCIPLRNWPQEGSWSCVSCVHDKLELTEVSCEGQGQPWRWCSIVDHSCKCPRPRYLPVQTVPPFYKRQNNFNWCLVFKGTGDETRATDGVMGRQPRAKSVSPENRRGVPPIILAFMIISRKKRLRGRKGNRKILFFN